MTHSSARWIALALCLGSVTAYGEVAVSRLFSDHMMFQRGTPCVVWGTADAGEAVTVSIGGRSAETVADAAGGWRVSVAAPPAGGPYELTIEGANRLTVRDVLVGDVWLCSGQSNMEWQVKRSSDADLERLLADHPNIRFLTIANRTASAPTRDVVTPWRVCQPQTVGECSGVGYFFAKTVHRATGVPIGLINASSGGSALEAWMPPETLEANPRFAELVDSWRDRLANYDAAADRERYAALMAEHARRAAANQAAGLPAPSLPWPPAVEPSQSNHRPGNCYFGMLTPVEGFPIKGVLWYQGESNVGRAYQYRDSFPLLISTWRDLWDRPGLPFYWVQLAGFIPDDQLGDDAWAELREAQAMTLTRVDHTGEALAIDVGETDDIHPTDKQTVGRRLARIALARDYGVEIAYENPRYRSHKFVDGAAVIEFDVEGSLEAHNGPACLGFQIAGADRVFVPARAEIVAADRVRVWSDRVEEPAAVRYAWDRGPRANVRATSGLPLTPFRTDDWDGVTKGLERKPAGFGP